MSGDPPIDDLLFEASTPLDFRVRVSRSHWELIIPAKHPVMAGREIDVRETLGYPSEIRRCRSDPTVNLFYSLERKLRWVCVVVKRLNGDGYLITTYPTDAIKEGIRAWPR